MHSIETARKRDALTENTLAASKDHSNYQLVETIVSFLAEHESEEASMMRGALLSAMGDFKADLKYQMITPSHFLEIQALIRQAIDDESDTAARVLDDLLASKPARYKATALAVLHTWIHPYRSSKLS